MSDNYVYIYLDPRCSGDYKYDSYQFSHKPIYVGIGTSDRYLVHLRSSKLSNKSLFYNVINKILDLGMTPIILKIKENSSRPEVLEIEEKLIRMIGRRILKEGPLCNIAMGGIDSPMLDPVVAKRCSKSLKGRHLSEIHKEKVRSSMLNLVRSGTHVFVSRSKEIAILSAASRIGNKNRSKKYKITRYGKEEIIENLKEYSSNNCINYSSMKECLRRGSPMRNGILVEAING